MKETLTKLNKPDLSLRINKPGLSNLLKAEVEKTFGKRIANAGDCSLLSEEVFIKTSYKINANTLRRFFGLVKTDYLPSWATLNILSQYCGFESYDELLESKEKGLAPDKLNEKEFLKYLYSLFKYLPVKEDNNETFMAFVKRTIFFMQQHPQLASSFQRAVAKTQNGQNFYFEQFANIDALNCFFGKGLLFYLNEKKTIEAQIFGHSLLCLKGWLTDDATYCKKHYEEVIKNKLTKSIHPAVVGRYFASCLYHAEMHGLNTERVRIQAHQVHASLRPAKNYNYFFPAFEYSFSSALILTGHYEEAFFYADYGLRNYKNRDNFPEKGFYLSLDLIKANALFHCGKQAEAKELYKKFQPSQFYFLTKKANTILYLCLRKKLKGLDEDDRKQLNEKIKETGFVRMTKYL